MLRRKLSIATYSVNPVDDAGDGGQRDHDRDGDDDDDDDDRRVGNRNG